jgi:hypothetical protein
MKKLLFIFLLIGITATSQNLLIENNTTIYDCIKPHQLIEYNGDLNFNGNYILTLNNTTLVIRGNVNGTGEIITNCNSKVYYYGYNNGNIKGNIQNGNSLSITQFNIDVDINKPYTLYSIDGKKLLEGITNSNMYKLFPKNQILLLKVEGFGVQKLLL